MISLIRNFVFWAALSGAASALFAEPPPNKPPRDPDDLSGRLIRKATTDSDEDLMDGIVRLMTEAAKKVEMEFDPGPDTQTLQKTIHDKLDEAVKLAASKQRTKRQTPSAESDRRRMPSAKREPPKRTPPKDAPSRSTESDPTSDAPAQAASGGPSDRNDLHDPRRGWGQLPQRQREEIIQGAGEGFLERYRTWVERYYRALQEKAD